MSNLAAAKLSYAVMFASGNLVQVNRQQIGAQGKFCVAGLSGPDQHHSMLQHANWPLPFDRSLDMPDQLSGDGADTADSYTDAVPAPAPAPTPNPNLEDLELIMNWYHLVDIWGGLC
ncbi:hypothetical protein ACJ72_05346 [Emergomyces africanus]|uniref:Uncharacterized protein n=1 Tax=Emergomyces africanus TaxID=1955775 RepID=A0A1B7NU62_9EURO|nr:hypothetical protein ACJ72_05346 [Emergomyces africanus]